MTLSDDMKTHVDTVFLNVDDFAETVTRHIAGNNADTETFPGVITWVTTQEEYSRGRANMRTGEMMVSDSVTVTVKDALVIDGYETQIVAVGPVQDGAYMVTVKQYLPESKGAAPVRTGAI